MAVERIQRFCARLYNKFFRVFDIPHVRSWRGSLNNRQP
jgi:hypothetical protein